MISSPVHITAVYISYWLKKIKKLQWCIFCTDIFVQSSSSILMQRERNTQSISHLMFACSSESTMPDMDNNLSPLCPNNKLMRTLIGMRSGWRGNGAYWLLSFFDEKCLWKAELSEAGKGEIKNEDGKSREWLSMILKASSGPLMKD